jgi:hypothetical protein
MEEVPFPHLQTCHLDRSAAEWKDLRFFFRARAETETHRYGASAQSMALRLDTNAAANP